MLLTLLQGVICLQILLGVTLGGTVLASGESSYEVSRDSSRGALQALLKWTFLSVRVKNRTLLRIKHGRVFKNRILAVLGPSGSGKTTFLHAISNRLPSTEHDIVEVEDSSGLDDDRVEVIKERGLDQSDVAVVYQQDSFFSMLTVLETITLASKLHQLQQPLDNKNTPLNSSFTIPSLLSSLSLSSIASSRIGDPSSSSSSSRGISGGERKRLSLACELIGNPKLLLLDEPTSGLDSYQAFNVIQILSNLARTSPNLAIALTIHSPTSSMWNLFDDILLLSSSGNTVYFGRREDIFPYFAKLNYHCPPQTNPAEWLLELVSIDSTSSNSYEQSLLRINRLVQAYLDSSSSSDGVVKSNTDNIITTSSGRMIPGNKKNSVTSFLRPRRLAASINRIFLLFQRALKQTVRDTSTNLARFLTSLVLGNVVGRYEISSSYSFLSFISITLFIII